MAHPDPYEPQTNFSSQPTSAFPPDKLDIELAAIASMVNAMRDNMVLVQRADGQLVDASVFLETLAPEVLTELGAAVAPALQGLIDQAEAFADAAEVSAAEAVVSAQVSSLAIVFRFAYSGATAYGVRDAVFFEGSTWFAKVPTTGNEPPAFPATSNTWWQALVQGRSAYQTAVANGYVLPPESTNPEADWIASLEGLSAYEVAVANGFVGDEAAWLLSLEGEDAFTTGAEIAAAYEAEADVNRFTDAEKTKLAAVEAGATADMTGAEIAAAYEAEANVNRYTDAEKTKLAGLEDAKFLGTYANLAALEIAHPAPVAGSYAYVDAGAASDVQQYVWDESDAAYVLVEGAGTTETPATIKTKYESNADTNAYTDAEQAKLAGIAAAATANATNAELRDRATHTGAQAIATVTGLQAILDDKASLAALADAVAASVASRVRVKINGVQVLDPMTILNIVTDDALAAVDGVIPNQINLTVNAAPVAGTDVLLMEVTANQDYPAGSLMRINTEDGHLPDTHEFWNYVQADFGCVRAFTLADQAVGLALWVKEHDAPTFACDMWIVSPGLLLGETFFLRAGSVSGTEVQPAADAALGSEEVFALLDAMSFDFVTDVTGKNAFAVVGFAGGHVDDLAAQAVGVEVLDFGAVAGNRVECTIAASSPISIGMYLQFDTNTTYVLGREGAGGLLSLQLLGAGVNGPPAFYRQYADGQAGWNTVGNIDFATSKRVWVTHTGDPTEFPLMYVDGAPVTLEVNGTPRTGAPVLPTNPAIRFGCHQNAAAVIDGRQGVYAVKNGVVSPEWIAAEFASLSAPATAFTMDAGTPI